MEYKYKIYNKVYNDMLSGKKTIEFRLLNEKSEKITINDTIKFIVVDNEDKYLITKVIDKYIYNDINELSNSNDIISNTLNYNKEELTSLFYNIFGKDNINKSKIVGFKIKVIK